MGIHFALTCIALLPFVLPRPSAFPEFAAAATEFAVNPVWPLERSQVLHSHFKPTMKNRESRSVEDADDARGFMVALMLNRGNIACILDGM